MAYRVTVTNTGSRAGAYSALAFHSPPNASTAAHDTADYMSVAPFKQLFDFGRVFLQPGEAKTVDFLLELGGARGPKTERGIRWSSASVDAAGQRVVLPGLHTVRVEGLSTGRVFEAAGAPEVVQSAL